MNFKFMNEHRAQELNFQPQIQARKNLTSSFPETMTYLLQSKPAISNKNNKTTIPHVFVRYIKK